MSKTSLGLCTFGLFCLAAVTSGGLQLGKDDQPPVPKEAVTVLVPTSDSRVSGTLTLTGHDDYVHIRGKVSHLAPGEHGFHIHEFGDLRDPKGESAGPHFNPTGESHGGPEHAVHHAGDLGNIVANDTGVAQVDMHVSGLKLHFAIGRSIVVHAKPDDLKSQPSGESGDRVAVGVIGVAKSKEDQ